MRVVLVALLLVGLAAADAASDDGPPAAVTLAVGEEGKPPKLDCPIFRCVLHCEHGFRKDPNGCEACSCKPAPPAEPGAVCREARCPEGYGFKAGCAFHGDCMPEVNVGTPNDMNKEVCEAGPYGSPDAGVWCEPGGKPDCPVFECLRHCEHGYRKDASGCDTCSCVDKPCPDVHCRLHCEHGFRKDFNGCPKCVCNPKPPTRPPTLPTPPTPPRPKPCPPVLCKLHCEHGFAKDGDGCQTCACKPAPPTPPPTPPSTLHSDCVSTGCPHAHGFTTGCAFHGSCMQVLEGDCALNGGVWCDADSKVPPTPPPTPPTPPPTPPPQCRARCGTQVGFIAGGFEDIFISYTGTDLDVPYQCKAKTCDAIEAALADAKAEIAAVKADAQAELDAFKASTQAEMQLLKDAIRVLQRTQPPTPAPTAQPTAAPTSSPTAAPTPQPTPHPCRDGSHGCDKTVGGICLELPDGGYKCACRSGYETASPHNPPHSAHACVQTSAPTPAPTPPTPAPTPACKHAMLGTAAQPASSCKDLNQKMRADHKANGAECRLPTDGTYHTTSGIVTCDMTTDGGGWTLRWVGDISALTANNGNWVVSHSDHPPQSMHDVQHAPYKKNFGSEPTEFLFWCNHIDGKEHWFTTDPVANLLDDRADAQTHTQSSHQITSGKGCTHYGVHKVHPEDYTNVGQLTWNEQYKYGPNHHMYDGTLQNGADITSTSCQTTYGTWGGPVAPHWIHGVGICFDQMCAGDVYTTGGYGTSSNHGVLKKHECKNVRYRIAER